LRLLLLMLLALGACQAKPPPATVPAALSPPLHALGTEPFWSVDLRDGRLTITRPDNPAVSGAATLTQAAANAATWEAKAADGRTVRLAVTAATCSDGMSDRTYPLSVALTIGTEALKCCASRG